MTFKDLTPFTVLLGANGSGKSTVFDVFAFLHEAFTDGLRRAWDRRNRMAGIRSIGQQGPVVFELKYPAPLEEQVRVVTYTLKVDEERGAPIIVDERLTWSTSPGSGRPRDIIRFSRGSGTWWDENGHESNPEELAGSDLLAVSALGQFRSHPRVTYLREFVSGWYLSYISAESSRTTPEAGPQRRLSKSGDNLPNVIQYLEENHPDRLREIFLVLGERVPQLEKIEAEHLADGRLLLKLKDRAFQDPVLARFASDGTLKLLAYLTVLMDPDPPPVFGIEEPENQLHPKLLPILAEEIRAISSKSQVFVTTHSPEFVSALRPKELWMIGRADDGYAKVSRASDSPMVKAMVAAGATLGDLWSEGYLDAADPHGLK
ncbi:AAA family ATPase [Mycobacterium canetti]|uniref:AAA family ATPase n=1 Tax=Mycobacterium canetti TaxID=78331 RepID=UPI0018D2A462|nr:AAA family ATPase [Mycobacterium canetti]